MLIIRPRKRNSKRDSIIVITSSLLMIGFSYYIMVVLLNAGMDMFCLISGLIIVMIVMSMAVMVPQNFVIDEDAEMVGLKINNTWSSSIRMESIKEVVYESDVDGRKSLSILGKNTTGSGVGISSPNFKEEDLKSVFERLSSLSQTYGFEVKEKYSSEDFPVISAESVKSNPEDVPYRVK